MCAGTPMVLDTYQTSRSDTYKNITVNDFCYRVIVFPVNHIAWGPGSIPIYFTFSKIPRELKGERYTLQNKTITLNTII